ncbi:MAG TPA: glycosyltransferase family 4 protein, partial [Acidimicrobiales bacterium]
PVNARSATGAGVAVAIGSRSGAIHQFVPALIPRDATGSHTLLLRDALRAAGWRSEIFAEATHDELLAESLPLEEYPRRARPGDVLVYQLSTSSAVADFLLTRSEPLVLDYHNITRPALSERWDPEPARRSAEALRQLAALAPRSVLGLADSHYNEVDLVAAGCPRTAVVPVLVDLDRLVTAPDQRVAARLAAEKGARLGGQVAPSGARADASAGAAGAGAAGADWLFVGRVVPSKAQHDLVKALWAYRRLYDSTARLHLVGSTPSNRYLTALRAFIADLGLQGAVRIAGEVSDAALAAYFDAADVYVSASLHEGFGVPLLEALHVGVPVVARSAGAVDGTVGDAGLLLDPAGPSAIAAAVRRVLTDRSLRDRLAAAGRRQVAEHTLAGSGQRTVDAIASVADAVGADAVTRAATRADARAGADGAPGGRVNTR